MDNYSPDQSHTVKGGCGGKTTGRGHRAVCSSPCHLPPWPNYLSLGNSDHLRRQHRTCAAQHSSCADTDHVDALTHCQRWASDFLLLILLLGADHLLCKTSAFSQPRSLKMNRYSLYKYLLFLQHTKNYAKSPPKVTDTIKHLSV